MNHMDNIDLSSKPESPEQARSMLETLRVQRFENQVTDTDYFARNEYLSRIVAGEENVEAPPDPYPTQEQQFERQWDEIMAPAKPHEYELRKPDGELDESFQAVDTAIRNAMSEAGIPKQYGGQLCEIADGLLTRFKDASADDVRAHTNAIGEKLKAQWGDDYEARLDAVSELLAGAAEKHPVVAGLLDEMPYAFANVWLMNTLWNVAGHRGGQR